MGGVGVSTCNFAIFSRKLHENKRNWTKRGRFSNGSNVLLMITEISYSLDTKANFFTFQFSPMDQTFCS